MKWLLVIASMAVIFRLACSDLDVPGSNYVGSYSYGFPSYAAPTYAVPSYGSVPSFSGISTYGGVPSYGVLPSYGGSSGYGGLSSYSGLTPMTGLTGISQGSEVGPGIPCMCAPAPPKICGSDFMTYSGWCNFKCAVTNNPDLKFSYLGPCRVARNDSHRGNDN